MKWPVRIAAGLGVFGVVAVVVVITAIPRDHAVELLVQYPRSSPAAVWRVITDHGAEPTWLPAFGTVERLADDQERPVWRRTSPDGAFIAVIMTILSVPERRYEFLLLRETQPRSQPWDGRWIFELEPDGAGTRLRIREFGWTGGVVFFVAQRVIGSPHAFLEYYARRLGRALADEPTIDLIRTH